MDALDFYPHLHNLPSRALAVTTVMRPALCGHDYDTEASPHWLVLSRHEGWRENRPQSVAEAIADAAEAGRLSRAGPPRIVRPYVLAGRYECGVDHTMYLRLFQRHVRRVLGGVRVIGAGADVGGGEMA